MMVTTKIDDMHQHPVDIFVEKMRAEITPDTGAIEEDGLNEKLESFMICFIHYMLEKIRNAQNELETGERMKSNTGNIFSEKPLQAACETMPEKESPLFPEKKIEQRFRD